MGDCGSAVVKFSRISVWAHLPCLAHSDSETGDEEDVENTARDIVAEVREAVKELRPSV